jgi:hypothetical protein
MYDLHVVLLLFNDSDLVDVRVPVSPVTQMPLHEMAVDVDGLAQCHKVLGIKFEFREEMERLLVMHR